jgi:hypothetical protein
VDAVPLGAIIEGESGLLPDIFPSIDFQKIHFTKQQEGDKPFSG